MKGPWRVESNWIGDRKMYRAYRQIDIAAVDHAGNREYSGGYVTDRSAVESAVQILNVVEAASVK